MVLAMTTNTDGLAVGQVGSLAAPDAQPGDPAGLRMLVSRFTLRIVRKGKPDPGLTAFASRGA